MKELLQRDFDILKQSTRNISIKLEIMNLDYKIIDSIEGYLISDSFNIDANSDMRRTYNFEMVVNDDKYLMNDITNLFMNKLICPYIGIKYERTQEIIWYKYGTFCIIDKSYIYDATTHSLSLSCEDMICLINGDLNGNLIDQKLEIKAGDNIYDIIVNLIKETKINKYMVKDINEIIPYDIDFSATTYYEMIKNVLNLFAGYELFFDIDGVLIIQKIPIKIDEEPILDDSIIEPLLISDNGTSTYKEIYNHIKMYGKQIEAERTCTECVYNYNTYNATFNILNSYENFCTYAIDIPNTNSQNCYLNINGIGAKRIVISENNVLVPKDYFKVGMYIFRYRKLTDDFIVLGQHQCFGEAWDDNIESPFNINNLGYEICKVLQDGDYEKISTDDLCTQQCKYEIYQSTNMKNDISLEMIFIPWLDVNYKVRYTSKNIGKTLLYVIKNISGNTTNGTMSINLIRYYPDYDDVF